jgi:hypothetical protein
VHAQEQHSRDFAAGGCLYVGERLEALAGDAAVRRSADRYIARLAGERLGSEHEHKRYRPVAAGHAVTPSRVVLNRGKWLLTIIPEK